MKRLLACFTLLALSACAPKEPDLRSALNSITTDELLSRIKVLSSDEFEGRAPGSKGEDLTVNYLTAEFQKIGLKPGNPDGTFIQKVPLAGIQSDSKTEITVKGKKLALAPKVNYITFSHRYEPTVTVKDSPIVFVGYGVVAPEYGWDDYKDVDVKGKTILMLINDPAVPDPQDPSKLDENMFKGRAMTYYGRWTYKYEIAAEKGAAAALIVHETGPAGYPFEVITGSNGRENFDIQRPDKNAGTVGVQGWMTFDKAKELCALAGQDLDALKKAAVRKDFRPVALPAKASFEIQNTLREVNSRNVVAKLEGSDPALKDEYVVYTAHWDHLGRDPNLQGDQIYNGALDNASGTSALLALAQAYAKLSPPKRSILFLSVTAEEKGLLGAKYYAENPLYPLKKTLANINIDGVNQWGRTKDFEIVGLGNSTLDDITTEVAKSQGRVIIGDAEPEKGHYYRSDHFEFAKQGVPALDTGAGIDYIGKPDGYGKKKRDEYTNNDYHKVSDEIKPDWDLSGAVEDIQLLFQVGYRVAEGDKYPEWKPGTEFKAKRDAMMKQP
ncbi:MAG: M28 family peptidase [Bryobacteraceae bacterium]|jgi:Zn-dependent M28 family amino/carboxypeptidase